MIDINDSGDFPKLIPDKSIHFEAKDEIRRSPETNFECSELEYKCTVAEKEYAALKLIPDMTVTMPDKKMLKHGTFSSRLSWIAITAAAAVLAVMLTVINNRPADSPETGTDSHPKTETNTVVEIKPAQTAAPETAPQNIPVEVPANSGDIPQPETVAETRQPVCKTAELETVPQNTPVETSVSNNDITRPDTVKIDRIPAISVTAETGSRGKTVFIYRPDCQPSSLIKVITGMTYAAGKISENIIDIKQNITQMLDGVRPPDILSRLNLDHGIDREINKWAKNNPDIPFDVFIDRTAEYGMKEIYDENGTLERVVFITNKSLKYKSNKLNY
ncbi:MAG: hypothetical protein LBK97_06165 [Prevotellaceae bacterium]|jgi:hypothetical protein|nr:hypothetical protein [Prevotellaceae bacterium]